ncbi:MAG: two-component system NtrC family sensor kinase, partial [Pirellulaceae bacterium]
DMLTRWPIRKKLLFGIAMLFLIVAILAISSFHSVYAYRKLARSISIRATELPYADELTRSVGELRFTISRLKPAPAFPSQSAFDPLVVREEFRSNFLTVKDALRRYSDHLNHEQPEDPRLGDHRQEKETIREIERTLDRIAKLNPDSDWVLNDVRVDLLGEQLDDLHRLSGELPSHLQSRMHQFAGEIRGEYRALIILTWVTSILAVGMLLAILRFFYNSVFSPLRGLVEGSRLVAKGEFSHRIEVNSHDEVAELAAAMNAMTTRFQEVRDDLDRQVQIRTQEVIRSEKLASVGFLAAGVAHEINNPLASIAWAAEALESRVREVIALDDERPDEDHNEEISVLKEYLRCIQDEAFRCKGITDSLLDYARMGDIERQNAELRELVAGVIGMIQHLGKYREKQIEFLPGPNVSASVNSQEIKQVVMNLITNALDSLESGGQVQIELNTDSENASLSVRDNGCGMSQEVLTHLFEPFFTHGKEGRGTGLGLSITHQIVIDHGGKIEVNSEGQGKGSQFIVILPKTNENVKTGYEEQIEKRQIAA